MGDMMNIKQYAKQAASNVYAMNTWGLTLHGQHGYVNWCIIHGLIETAFIVQDIKKW